MKLIITGTIKQSKINRDTWSLSHQPTLLSVSKFIVSSLKMVSKMTKSLHVINMSKLLKFVLTKATQCPL
jgi:hypothetical protein